MQKKRLGELDPKTKTPVYFLKGISVTETEEIQIMIKCIGLRISRHILIIFLVF